MNKWQANTWQEYWWEMESQAVQNGTAKWMYRWRKVLHGCSQTDAWMKKIFAQMQSNGYTADGWRLTADGNFWTDAIKWCETIQCERMQIFFAWIAQAVRTIGPPNLFEWLTHGIKMAIHWKLQTTRNIFGWEVTIFTVFFPVIFKSCWHYCLDKNLPVFKCPDYYLFAF